MNILWIGDGGASTGFATVTHAIGDRLVERGHTVSCLAANYNGDWYPTKVRLYRANAKEQLDVIGRSRVVEIIAETEPDVVIMLNDPHTLTNLLFKNAHDTEFILLRYRPLIAYVPIDGDNLPAVWNAMGTYVRRVAMSQFGQRQMPGSELIYHGVDTDTFYQVSSERPVVTSEGLTITSKREAKKAFGYNEDGFLVLRVDRNSGRKDFGTTWRALLPVMHRHPDIEVHFHCTGNDPAGGPIMPALFSRDLETAERFHLPPAHSFNTIRGWKTNDLVALYNAADLFVSTSMGEGFGLTLAEAMACGVPVIAQNFSAITEVVGPGGMLLRPGSVVMSPSGQEHRLARTDEFTKAIEKLYGDPRARAELSQRGMAHVKANFNWDVAADKFEALAQTIYEASLLQGSDPGAEAIKEAVPA